MNSKPSNPYCTPPMDQKSTRSTAKMRSKCHQVDHLQKECKVQTPKSCRGGGAGKKEEKQVTGTSITNRQEP